MMVEMRKKVSQRQYYMYLAICNKLDALSSPDTGFPGHKRGRH